MKKLFVEIMAFLFIVMAGCSGGGGGSSDGHNTEPETFSITGQIVSNNTGLSGVTVSLSGANTAQTTTDSNGQYSFTGLANGNYTVTPSLSDYVFSPSGKVVTINGTDKAGIDFTATASITPTYSVSGQVSGAVVSGVTITLTGTATASTTTDFSGNYIFSNLVNGTYTVTPTLAGYKFNPINSVFTINGANISSVNFIATLMTVNLRLINVPAGSFQRDAAATNISIVSAFRMSQYEITRAQFLSVMGHDPTRTEFSSGSNDPVRVNWYHAIAFCNKISIAEGLTPVYSVNGVNFSTLTYAEIPNYSENSIWDAATANWSANGYRLPTEMEWMWAAMGATSGYGYTGETYTTGYTKAFAGSTGSNNIGDYAWYYGNYSGTTHPVGTKLPNELGFYDMSGNITEWCWDWDEVWPDGTLSNYRGVVSDELHRKEVRGGSYNDLASQGVLIARRGSNGQYSIGPGFRVVRN